MSRDVIHKSSILRMGFWARAVMLVSAAMLVSGSVARAQRLGVLYRFMGGTDGADPEAALIQDASGNLYGTTFSGGSFNLGTVFEINTAGTETVLYSFTGAPDGASPYAGLVRDAAGNLYGTTYAGGKGNCGGEQGCGTVFRVDKTGTETVLYRFTGGTDGAHPEAGLIRDVEGNLYGTAAQGSDLTCGFGRSGCGTIFQVDPAGKETVLYSFAGTPDGGLPEAELTSDSAGNLYSTTILGGDNPSCEFQGGCGTVFKLDEAGNETLLYSFSGGTDRLSPEGGVVRDAAGNLYGITLQGGDLVCGGGYGCGVVFGVDTAGKETILHSFAGTLDGDYPFGGVILDAAGNLYGTTSGGGDLDGCSCGTIFKVDASGRTSVVHRFSGGTDGEFPLAGLTLDAAGRLYGTTLEGGDLSCGGGCGIVFVLPVETALAAQTSP